MPVRKPKRKPPKEPRKPRRKSQKLSRAGASNLPAPDTGTALATVDPLRRYLAIIRQFSLLTPEEEKNLAVRYRLEKDREAQTRLVTGNLRLVVRIALDMRRAYSNILDLIQEGNIGLIMAIHRYDPFQGTRLSTYATWWIRAYIIKYLLDNWSVVRVGTTNLRRKLFFNLKREKERLEQMGIEAGPKLLAERFGASEQDVIDVEKAVGSKDVSLDAPQSPGEGWTYLDRMESPGASQEEIFAREELQGIVRKRVAEFGHTLKENELLVLQKRVAAEEPVTLQNLADQLGMTREGVRKIELRVKEKLKSYLESDSRLSHEIRKI